MSSKYLLVDGYNVIFNWKNLTEIANTSLEDARIKLLETMCNYQGYKKYEVIVVFDAYKVKNGTEKTEIYKNIKVVFTKEAETADTYIERACGKLGNKYSVTVVTSDYLEQIIIISKGALRMSCRELEHNIKIANAEISEFIDKKPIKNNMLADNVDKKTLEFLEKIRFGKE